MPFEFCSDFFRFLILYLIAYFDEELNVTYRYNFKAVKYWIA